MEKALKVYAAGIHTRNGNWIWQGTVVAQSLKEGKQLLSNWKKSNGIPGTSEVVAIGEPQVTSRPKGVSDSMLLN